MRIAHIINPVRVNSSSDLFVAQPVTFESMRRAATHASGSVNVDLYTAQFPEDSEIIPDFFRKTPDLSRSIRDVALLDHAKKLPLIKDILDRLYEADPHADYLIYSNVDIALQPHFYIAVKQYIEQGFDALVINRRTIPADLNTVAQLEQMYAHPGEPHPGYDCFVFRRTLYPSLALDNVCIGARYIGKLLVDNLRHCASRFQILTDEQLTFHIGNDRTWDSPAQQDLNDFNRTAYEHNMKRLKLSHNIMFPDNNSVLEQISTKRLIFTVTTGRSGTGLLADLINSSTTGDVACHHEPEPHFAADFEQNRGEIQAAKRFLIEKKFPAILQTDSKIYIETSHLFCKGFFEAALSLGVAPELIILRRPEREVATSMYQLNTIPGRTEKGRKFYLSPDDPGILFKPQDDSQYNDYQMCFWYALEIRARQERYRLLYETMGSRTYFLPFSELVSGRAFNSFLRELNLPLRLFKKSIKPEKVNDKQGKKRGVPYSRGELYAFEKRVLSDYYSAGYGREYASPLPG